MDEHYVYFATVAGITRMPKSGGAPVLIATERDNVASLAVDSTSIYWSSPATSAVMRVPKEGGTPTVVSCSLSGKAGESPCYTPPYVSRLIGVLKDQVFVEQPVHQSWSNVVMLPTGGGIGSLINTRGTITDFASLEPFLVWTSTSIVHVYSIGLTGNFDVIGPSVGAVALDGSKVFWTRWIGYTYDLVSTSLSLDGTEVTSILSNVRAAALAVSDVALYSVSEHGIQRTDKRGAAATVIEPNASPSRMFVDADCLYYQEPVIEGGTLFRVVRIGR